MSTSRSPRHEGYDAAHQRTLQDLKISGKLDGLKAHLETKLCNAGDGASVVVTNQEWALPLSLVSDDNIVEHVCQNDTKVTARCCDVKASPHEMSSIGSAREAHQKNTCGREHDTRLGEYRASGRKPRGAGLPRGGRQLRPRVPPRGA